MSEFFITENDRLPVLRANLSDDAGYIDLTNGTGYFVYKNKYATGQQPTTGNADFLGLTSGYVQYQWPSGSAGVFYGKWKVLSNGKWISFPNESFLNFAITEDLFSL